MKKLFALFLIQIVMVPVLFAQTKGAFTWSGGTSTDPTVGSNWVGGTAPTFTSYIIADNLTIPSGCPNWPVFSNTAIWYLYNSTTTPATITIYSGASVTFTNRLNITQSNRLGTVIVNPGATLKVYGLLFINPPGSLVVKSDDSGEGQAWYGSIGGTSALSSIELYLLGSSSQFHYFVPPLGVYIGTLITDVKYALSITKFNGDLLLYDEPSAVHKQDGWQYFDGFGGTTGFESISPSQGYNIYLTGNDKLIFKGNLNVSSQTYDLSYTSGNADPGWNLIGNPFPCNYDLSTVAGLGTSVAGIGNVVHYNHAGDYYYYNCLIHTGSSGYTSIVPPMTGFFVHVLATGKSLLFNAAGKTFSSGDTRSQHKGGAGIESSSVQLVRLQLNSGTEKDESIVWIANDATSDYNEHYDGVKLFGKNTSYIYSELNFRDYFMKAVTPPVKTLVEVPLKVKLGTSGEQSISITQFDNMQDFNVKLKHGTVETPLKSGTAYTFNSEAGTYDDFSLIFENATVGVETNEFISLKTWYAGSYLYMNFADNFTEGIGSLTIFDFNGRKVSINNNLQITPGETIQVPVNLVKGFYIIDLLSGNKHYKSKIVVY